MFYARINKLKIFNNREGFPGVFNRAEILPDILPFNMVICNMSDKVTIPSLLEKNVPCSSLLGLYMIYRMDLPYCSK
jgi:hypothetical protein